MWARSGDFCDYGIYLEPFGEEFGGGVVRLNEVTGVANTGILALADRNALIVANTTARNGCRGILGGKNVNGNVAYLNSCYGIAGATGVVKNNVAYNNQHVGIWAADGAIDGGNNRAIGHGEQQCINVSCEPYEP